MSGPTPTGNGCSLENCYTNIFALTDICGIKWRKLCIDPLQTHIDPFEDPVLSSYAKCLQADILCVWRRSVKHSEQHPADISFGKELWIFWYGDQPNGLDSILSPVLKEHESGSWEKESVLSYECRTLLFKALHNLIERCLLSKNFIRLGKWFVQPQDQGVALEQNHLSFCFNFFLHGESTVCASIEVKQHPVVTFLGNHHLNHIQESQTQLQVILAPYGLQGTLTGVTYRDSDQMTRKHLDEWKQFYPVKTNEAKENDLNVLPNLVEVIVAGVRMKYPSCFVLLVDEHHHRQPGMGDRQNMMNQQGSLTHGPMTGPTTPEDAINAGLDMGMKFMGGGFSSRPEPVSDLTARTNGLLGTRLIERVHHDSCATAGITKVQSEGLSEESIPTSWPFADPSSKVNCHCPRTKASKNKTNVNQPGKPGEKKKADKLDRQHSKFVRSTPFHRRTQAIEDFVSHDMDSFMPRASPNSGLVGNQTGAPNQVGAGGAVTQPPGPGSDTVNLNSVGLESPASIAPSPLEDSHNQNQLENGASMDPTMPTLSPHPPVLKHSDKDSSLSKQHVQSDQNANMSGNNNNNGMVNGLPGDPSLIHKSVNMSVMKVDSLTSLNSVPYSWSQQVLENTKANNINSWLRSQQKQVDYSKGFKRPVLPTLDGDADELITETLYNFDPVHNWSDFPLKKVCYDRSDHMNGVQDVRFNSNNLSQNLKPFKPPTPQPPAADPYDFSDESSSTPATISRGSMRNSRDMFQRPSPLKDEEPLDPNKNYDQYEFKPDRSSLDFGPVSSPPTTPGTQAGGGSLTRTVDLIPQKSDLDNLFDTDSDSNDDAFVPESPAGQKGSDDNKNVKPTNTGPVDIIAPSELSRMYPTPPSLENNPVLSPMTSADAPPDTTIMEGITFTNIKTEVVVGSLTEELSKESMSVFKPDPCAVFPSSIKYRPVDLYSCQLSPPPEVPDYKPSWQYGMAMMDKSHPHHISQYMNIPSIENVPSIPSTRMPSSAIEASPAAFQNSVGQQKTPLSYELQSPASNASSYLKTPQSNINHHIGTNNQIAEAHSLIVNIVLSDSMLNLFKDHSFDNCNICVCNMTIKGSDLGLYIPNPTGEQEYKCTCGFSAVVNKRHGCNAGLFYEDEVDITGIRDDRFEARKPSLLSIDYNKVDESGNKVRIEEVSQVVLQLMLGQYSVPYPTCSTVSLLKKIDRRLSSYPSSSVNVLQLQDGNEVTYGALDHGRQAMEHCHPSKLEDNLLKSTCLHKWAHIQGPSLIPQSSVDCVRLLKSLQPLLQDAIQNKRVTRLWEHTYKLQGPLTWIEFHQLAGRGSDENSEPQPIPSLLVGCEKDAAHVSPFAVKYWDKNLLEPYGHRRDIAYVIVTPDNDFAMSGVKTFFKELSTAYEWSRLGRHCPVSDVLRDGILRIGRSTAEKVGELDCDEWFKYTGDGDLASKLRLYAKACKHQLAPFLAQQDLKSMFTPTKSSQRSVMQRPLEVTNNSENLNSSSEEREVPEGERPQRESHEDLQDSHELPAIVIYLINPFTHAQDWDDLNRLAVIGLLKCYQEIVPKLPELMQSNVYLQIVPLETIIDYKDTSTQFQLLKNMAFSVFTSCRWNLNHTVLGRSLTGFGPAAAADTMLKRGNSQAETYKLYCPPFVLAPIKDKQEQLAESCSEKKDDSTILMCVYCLSEDQRWLLAACTDERGETIETCTINIDIPNRNRRKKTSARKIGLGKLWEFIQGVVSMSSKPCRVVICRFGRIGHGELKGWSGLLSKKNIQQCSKRMREMCSQCSFQTNGDYPYIVSACLTSIEQQNSFLVLPDCVNPEEKHGSNCPLQTPRDCSCSHILVFPTSATAQANTNQIQLDSTGGIDLGGHNLEFGVDLSDFNDNNDDFGSLMDVFNSMTNSPPGSPRHDNPGSPGLGLDLGPSSPNKMNGISMANTSATANDPQDDPNLLQQPLAMGYYISTAQTGPLPKWFWSVCPENEMSPVKCFKSALHLHTSTNQDDFMHQASTRNTHPLDSNLTCDVLRFVLEKYNALSWLTYDPARNDRKSCLPIHFMVLMQMYHAMNAFV